MAQAHLSLSNADFAERPFLNLKTDVFTLILELLHKSVKTN